MRQWVLTMPYRLRYQMAWSHGLSRAVLRVYTRALLDVYRRDARTRGSTIPGRARGWRLSDAFSCAPSKAKSAKADVYKARPNTFFGSSTSPI